VLCETCHKRFTCKYSVENPCEKLARNLRIGEAFGIDPSAVARLWEDTRRRQVYGISLEDYSLPHLTDHENLVRWLYERQGYHIRTIAKIIRVSETALQDQLRAIRKKVDVGLKGKRQQDKRRKA